MELVERRNGMVDRKIDISKKYQSAIRDEKKRILALRTEKYCKHCGMVKPLDDFYPPSVSGLTPISVWCKECIREYSKTRYWRRRANRIANRKLNRR